MTRPLSFTLLVAMVVFGAASLAAQEGPVGEIIRPPDPHVSLTCPPLPPQVAQHKAAVPLGCALETDAQGSALFNVSDKRVPRERQNVALLENSALSIRKPREHETGKIAFELMRGTMRWVGVETIVYTQCGKAGIRTFGTAFVARYDPRTDTAEIVGMNGHAEVSNRIAGGAVSVGVRELTRVVSGNPPTAPRLLSDVEFQGYVRPFELMGGGRAESQTINDPVLIGSVVPDLDRAPERAAAPPQDSEAGRERSSFFDQPLSVIRSTDLGVEF